MLSIDVTDSTVQRELVFRSFFDEKNCTAVIGQTTEQFCFSSDLVCPPDENINIFFSNKTYKVLM